VKDKDSELYDEQVCRELEIPEDENDFKVSAHKNLTE
jgi:hypothetical protein